VITFFINLPLIPASCGYGAFAHRVASSVLDCDFLHCMQKVVEICVSTGGALPSLVEFELRGIPTHDWASLTVVQLLSTFAWIHCVQPGLLGLVDLFVFRCTAWTKDVASIPTSRELWIVEPPSVPD
jgi:hypothetical protein